MLKTMKALVLIPSTGIAVVQDVPHPIPGPGEVLVRVHAVAVNPVEQFYYAHPIAAQERRVMGVDFAGEVVKWNEDLNGSSDKRVKAGARVAGFVQGGLSCLSSSIKVHLC